MKDAVSVAWRPVVSKVSATKQPGDEAEDQAVIARSLPGQLLCLHRLDTANREAYEASIGDEAIWTIGRSEWAWKCS